MPGSHAGRGNRQDDKKSGAQKQDRQNMQAGGGSKAKSSHTGEGRGWHGDSEGHSKAAKKGADK